MRSRPIRPIRSILAVVAGLAFTLAACSGDDDATTDPSAVATDALADTTDAPAADATDAPADDTIDTTGAPAGETAGDNTITIADFAFGGVTEVPVGTTIVVSNDDGTAHTWTAVDGSFDSGSLGQGDSFEFTFEEVGEFEYFCNIHPSMTGTITVTG